MQDNKFGGSPIPDFARRWNLAESTVWLYIKQRKIRTVKFGDRNTRIPREEEERISREGFSAPGVATGVDAGVAASA